MLLIRPMSMTSSVITKLKDTKERNCEWRKVVTTSGDTFRMKVKFCQTRGSDNDITPALGQILTSLIRLLKTTSSAFSLSTFSLSSSWISEESWAL